MPSNCFLADKKFVRYIAVCFPGSDELQDLGLAFGQRIFRSGFQISYQSFRSRKVPHCPEALESPAGYVHLQFRRVAVLLFLTSFREQNAHEGLVIWCINLAENAEGLSQDRKSIADVAGSQQNGTLRPVGD